MSQLVQKTRIPRLRFPGFFGDWEEKKVINFAPLQRGFDLPTANVQDGIYPVAYSNGILRYHNEYKAKGPGVFTGRSGTIGNVFYIENDYRPHNTSLWVTDFKGNYPKFVYYFYTILKLETFGTGSGVPTLNRNDIHSLKKYFPPLQEQTKIADFLTVVDDQIQSLSQLRDVWSDYKTGMMQQIFSQQIRFDGFTEEWGEKKLGEVCEIQNNKRKPITAESRNSGIYPYYGATGIIDYVEDYIFDEELLLVGEDGAKRGKNEVSAFIAKGKYWVNNHAHALKIKQEYSIVYLMNILNYKNLLKYVAGNAPAKLTLDNLKKILILIPSLPEQQKIANFLSSIDDKIAELDIQIQTAKQWKKGLLQGLFI